MTFAFASPNITQSGTDANLSGMSGIAAAGFTYQGSGLRNVINNISNTRLTITGNLTIPHGTDQYAIGAAANAIPIVINPGARLTLTNNSNGQNFPGFGIKSEHNNGLFWGNGVILCNGTLEMLGSGVYSTAASLNFGAGATFIGRNAIIRGGQYGGTTTMFRNSGGATTYDVDGLTLIDMTFVCEGPPTVPIFRNYVANFTVGGTNNVAFIPQGTWTLIGPQFIGNIQTHFGTSKTSGNGELKRVYGFLPNLAPRIGKVPDWNVGVNWVEGRKKVNVVVRDVNLNTLSGVITYFTDVDNGRRYNGTSIGAPNYTLSNTYNLVSDASGIITMDLLLWEVAAPISAANTIGGVTPQNNVNCNMVVDYRWPGNSHNISINIPLINYRTLIGSLTFSTDGLDETISPSVFLTLDPSITLTEAAAVAKLASSFTVNTGANTITVTAASTLDDLYDAMKAFKTRNVPAQLLYPTITTQPVTANGETATTAMSVLGAHLLTAGTKIKRIQANLAVGAAFTNLSVIGNVDQATPTTLTDVSITGTLTYNTNTPVTITFPSSVTIGTVRNLGTAIVTLKGGTITTAGTNVVIDNTIPSDISVTGLIAGSRLQVFNVTKNLETFNSIVAGTSYTAQYTGTTQYAPGDILRIRATRVTGTTAYLGFQTAAQVGALGWSVLVNQVVDAVYNEIGIDGSTVTEFLGDVPNVQIDINDPDNITTLERLYSWFSYNQHTSAGIGTFFGGITASDRANYNINGGLIDLSFDNRKTTMLTIGGGYITKTGGSPSLVAPLTIGSIYFASGRAYIAASESIVTNVSAIKAKTDNLPPDPASNTQVNTRLAAADYVPGGGGPTAVQIRQEIDANSTKLDVAVSTRLPTAGYTAPNNADITAIKAKTDNLPAQPANQLDLIDIKNNTTLIPGLFE